MERWLAYFANQLSDDEMGELIMSDEAIHKAVDAARTFLQNDAEPGLHQPRTSHPRL